MATDSWDPRDIGSFLFALETANFGSRTASSASWHKPWRSCSSGRRIYYADKQISLFEPCVTILTSCECTEIILLISEDAPGAKICTTGSPGGSQFTEALLLTALETLHAIPIPSHNPFPPCTCSATCSESRFSGLPTGDLGAARINSLLLT